MKGEILYVLSDNRSGSTLLDQLLGVHPKIVSVGELHWLDAYVREDRRLYDPVHPLVCACGQPVPACAFWNEISAAAGKQLDSFQIRPKYFEWRARGNNKRSIRKKITQLPRRFIGRFPATFLSRHVQRVFGAPRLAQDSLSLADAIFTVSGCRYIVDSSKNSFRFRAIYDRQPDRVRAVVLARDYRAVVHSKMKRGRSLEDAANGWRKKMLEIDALTADLPPERCYRLKYETLCNDPQQELTRICGFLGLELTPGMLQRPTRETHHIGGSPSKFDPSRVAISLDTAYQGAFDANTLAKLSDLVGDIAESWGY